MPFFTLLDSLENQIMKRPIRLRLKIILRKFGSDDKVMVLIWGRLSEWFERDGRSF